MGHQYHWWARWPSTFKLLILNFHTHSLCDKLPEADFIFGINLQKGYSLSYYWESDRQLFLLKKGSFLSHIRNSEQHHNIAAVKSALKILPKHNGTMSIKINRHNLRGHVVYFISNQHTKKGLDTNIHVIDGIYDIKGKSTLYNKSKHVTFNKGQCIGHMVPLINNTPQTSVNSSITQNMMDEQFQVDTLKPTLHKLSQEIQQSLAKLLETFKSQFVQDKTSISTEHLNKMQTDTGTSEPVSQRPYPIAMKHYDWVQNEINKLLYANVIHSSHSSWSALIITVPKGDSRKHLIIDYRALTKVTQKYIWPMAKVKDIFSKLSGAPKFSTIDLQARYHHISLDGDLIPKTAFRSPFRKYEYLKVPFGLAQMPAYFQELMNKVLKDLPFAIAYLDDIVIYSKTVEEYLDHLQQVFHKPHNAKLSLTLCKCHFFAKEIQYLGHVLITTGIKALPLKTETTKECQTSTNFVRMARITGTNTSTRYLPVNVWPHTSPQPKYPSSSCMEETPIFLYTNYWNPSSDFLVTLNLEYKLANTLLALTIAKKTLDENRFKNTQKTKDHTPPSFQVSDRVYFKNNLENVIWNGEPHTGLSILSMTDITSI